MTKNSFLRKIDQLADNKRTNQALSNAADFAYEIVAQATSKEEAMETLKKHAEVSLQFARECQMLGHKEDRDWHSDQAYAYSNLRSFLRNKVEWT
jgi:antirestriction protein